jgi:hypothetical protein
MPIAMHHESDNTYRLDISGVLERADQAEPTTCLGIQRWHFRGIRKAVVRPEGVRRLATRRRLNNLAFYVNRGDAIERIAIVGEERWRDLTMMFASADLAEGAGGVFSRT